MGRRNNGLSDHWCGKTVLITGVCGTVGRELLRQVLAREPGSVVGIDNNESELFFLHNDHLDLRHVSFSLTDLRDRNSLMSRMAGVDVVLHAAAHKHVILCERAPEAAIQTNIIGTQNVIDAALTHNVERVLFTSSDKAVNPTNVMGTSKLMGERLMTAANAQARKGHTIFVSTRFGNVLGSRGSVIPIFHRQIAGGGPVTLTDGAMTRFIMTLPQAVSLVINSVFLGKGGEVFVTKMPIVRIEDLAHVMVEELAPLYGHDPSTIEIVAIGAKEGEKLYEELMNEEEIRRAIEFERYYAILPAFRSSFRDIDYTYPDAIGTRPAAAYNSASAPAMSREQLRR